MSRDVQAAHTGGFAEAQRFPQPLVDCHSSAKRNGLSRTSNRLSPEANDKVINLFLLDRLLFYFLFLLSKASQRHQRDLTYIWDLDRI
jgi:hypothetical protein